jgi:hypothetical protein
MCDPGSLNPTCPVPPANQALLNFFYFDFIIDTILFYFFNGYGSIRYVDVFCLYVNMIKKGVGAL